MGAAGAVGSGYPATGMGAAGGGGRALAGESIWRMELEWAASCGWGSPPAVFSPPPPPPLSLSLYPGFFSATSTALSLLLF